MLAFKHIIDQNIDRIDTKNEREYYEEEIMSI